tara:strand:- start:1282 stop:2697 length:1416 start_codon:yes stop_codon:yes gene_type:complete
MATLGTDRTASTGNLPPIDGAAGSFRIKPETYTTVDTLIKTTKDEVMPNLVETYGDQGITGFLKLTGAINSGGSSDQIDWWEAGRRHKSYSYVIGDVTDNTTSITVAAGTDSFSSNVQANDVVMDSSTGTRFIVKSGGFGTGSAVDVVMVKLDGSAVTIASDLDLVGGEFIKLGNMYAQGTNQPTAFDDFNAVRKSNPFMIVKDRYEVNGSQATNIGWVNVGGGEYRWFMKGEQEARARFEDRREMMMLLGQQHSGTAGAGLANDIAGSEGYFAAIEDRGIQVSNANSNPLDSFSEFDDIIMELDKQGAPSEYAMYVNRKQDLAIDDMLASGISTSVSAGLPGQFGAFNNDADMAVKLGFKSFTRGGYTFHKHDWKLLNDPTLLGASNYIQGAMIPLSQVTDARSGMKAPALAMYYKEANGYNREMEHWVTGSILGHTNNGDQGQDNAVFHYRSEISLCTRAANQHVMIKG